MSARTDRIAKLDGLIAECAAKGFENKQAKFTALRDKFVGMLDSDYDYLIALNTATLANPNLKSQDFYRSYYSRKEG